MVPRRGVFALVVAMNDNAIMLSAEVCAPEHRPVDCKSTSTVFK
jgi:hypothetical protein